VKLPIFVARQWIRHRTANGPVRHPPYETMSNFLLEGRLRLLYKNATAVTTAQTACVSAVLAVLTAGI
ncbi:MAG TPA: hypothetical protein PLA94_15100, partial [Myxococcota bacterium]|nr:hypothetical protein [Myxococcota bacterium]